LSSLDQRHITNVASDPQTIDQIKTSWLLLAYKVLVNSSIRVGIGPHQHLGMVAYPGEKKHAVSTTEPKRQGAANKHPARLTLT